MFGKLNKEALLDIGERLALNVLSEMSPEDRADFMMSALGASVMSGDFEKAKKRLSEYRDHELAHGHESNAKVLGKFITTIDALISLKPVFKDMIETAQANPPETRTEQHDEVKPVAPF